MGLYCAIPVDWIVEGTTVISEYELETSAQQAAFSAEPYGPKGDDEEDDSDAEEFYDAVWDYDVPEPEQIDISLAIDAFKSAFENTINALCPVRTGFLRSSCHCETSDDMIECFADAEYAQYVEYGTYKMEAQPYFEPAIAAGLQAFLVTLNPLLQTVKKTTESIAEEVISEIIYAGADFSLILVLIAIILIAAVMALIAELFSPLWEEWGSNIAEALMEYSLYTEIV